MAQHNIQEPMKNNATNNAQVDTKDEGRSVDRDEDKLKLSFIDRGFIGTPPIMSIAHYRDQRIDPQDLYRAIVETLEQIPPLSSKVVVDKVVVDKVVVDNEGEHWLQHVPSFFNFTFDRRPELDADELFRRPSLAFSDLAGLIYDAPAAIEKPSLSVNLTHDKHGSVLSYSLSHCAGDGETLKYFGFFLMQRLQERPIMPCSPQRGFGFQRQGRAAPKAVVGAYEDHLTQVRHQSRQAHMGLISLSGNAVKAHLAQLSGRAPQCTAHDVIAAWLVKNHAHKLVPEKERINIRIPVNLRPLSERIDMTYIGNGFIDIFLSWSRHEAEEMPLTDIAMQIRERLTLVKNPTFIDERVALDTNGIVFDKFVSEGEQGFDPDNDIIITSVGDVRPHIALLGQPATHFVGVPAVPLAFVVHKIGADYMIITHSKHALELQ